MRFNASVCMFVRTLLNIKCMYGCYLCTIVYRYVFLNACMYVIHVCMSSHVRAGWPDCPEVLIQFVVGCAYVLSIPITTIVYHNSMLVDLYYYYHYCYYHYCYYPATSIHTIQTAILPPLQSAHLDTTINHRQKLL
jgi:hypothetical protein